MRALAVVVVTDDVIVVRRLVDVVARGVAVGAAATVVVDGADGCSGAAVFWTCVAAKAVMPPTERKVTPVAMARSATLEVMRGRLLGMGTRGTSPCAPRMRGG